MKGTPEQLISKTILQEPIDITINGKPMQINKPTLATLIEISALASQIPVIPRMESEDEILQWVLSNAKDCAVIADIAAALILGSRTNTRRFGISWRQNQKNTRSRLAKKILEHYSPKEVFEIVSNALSVQEIGFFLSTITTLQGANVLKKTTTTASGD